MLDPIINFAVRGALDPLRLGMHRSELLAALGPPQGTTGQPEGKPVMWCYDDLQIGLSGHHMVWYIALEPSGSRITLPAPMRPGPIEAPAKDALLRDLASRGEAAEECAPYAPGELWWRVPASGVLMSFCADGPLDNIHISDRSLLL
ncbi:hypothetical protein [Microbispora sp. NBRC 16548]|uniref:hypothetical protein n=1 Tax=Microbispora sp. NBRC 16548 TaxID=3030994 RepID=UPI0024A45B40|nr:hypothetical protein [Microbispora sp. NBRC 16548]GLX05469.1 hypothetical protein Misp03_23960 [Microbispora sp. NBRC 16548]